MSRQNRHRPQYESGSGCCATRSTLAPHLLHTWDQMFFLQNILYYHHLSLLQQPRPKMYRVRLTSFHSHVITSYLGIEWDRIRKNTLISQCPQWALFEDIPKWKICTNTNNTKLCYHLLSILSSKGINLELQIQKAISLKFYS